MRLRSITLAGFKTFARQTEIAFDPGVTAVVGPNGSGKSNTVDAFKWALGETQARDLRGRRMEEVVYAGGLRRPRAPAAEVTVVIDNSDGQLPIDYQEVAIRRRMDRGGQSDYFLNGSRVRRRDVAELLVATGLTTDSYAIVSGSDVESIISASPEQRRQLIEAAAQVRGVKARRTEATAQLQELARNLLRLEDLRTEIVPRLEVVRAQAAAAREAAEARRRLELLRGSIAWEEWREARDSHRRASAQAAALERSLADARRAAVEAEVEFARRRQTLQAAQDHRLRRQEALSERRLELAQGESRLALAGERVRGAGALLEAARVEAAELDGRLATVGALRSQLAGELAQAETELARIPEPAPPPEAGAAAPAAELRQAAERARRDLVAAEAGLGSARTRRQFLEESRERLGSRVAAAEAALPESTVAAAAATVDARAAAEAGARRNRLRAELEGLESLWPAPRGELRRVGDVILAEGGFEAALSAVLGPLVEAWAAPDEAAAARAVQAATGDQATILYPVAPPAPGGAPDAEAGSLVGHVRCERGFEDLARRLLGGAVVGRDVSLEGVYRQPGLVRAGSDPRVALAARRRRLWDESAELEAVAARAPALEEASRRLRAREGELRAAAGERPRLEETARLCEEARAAESRAAERLAEAERRSAAAEQRARALAQAAEEEARRLAEHRNRLHQLELERARWRERAADLRRQLGAVQSDGASLERARAAGARRAAAAERARDEAGASLKGLEDAVEAARARMLEVESASPDDEAELAEAARRMVGVEEARVDARLKVSTLEGNAGLFRREAELAAARMEELRARMPEGLAPEEVPGGRAREREMRQLERRLEQIGPTNELAAGECAELEERYGTLLSQLEDITAARSDLEELVRRLRQEEESRYGAVFGAVAASFREYFGELTAGGQATLREVAGEDGPKSGVEILVQPPRKRVQNVTLLSTGERALTALALVLALQEVNPPPFAILDEVDAALDDANVGRFGGLLQRLGRTRQLMIITHNHATMASASALYGVHLDESGCSHLVSVRLEDVRPAAPALPAQARTA